ncbi:type II toxin-antitoxin system ParD family antitoxin [Propionimicrobium sp. PCR01-08-3]|uniref:ribbon-helix-helix domain-containing protein n=1 Tax=Propionimicrobium sp. PCR01-08-3 TaxID=3052086 RepID=UPI00255CE1F9|nr:type II toxin-antitoxin system ParD family antitoxin [Propionimicrobium sp. PCR01-08-3]WIY82609.1 type II toxin-antitoxin system ParD family antitoxin [Propionimicrobium sp. PCR01-08-3]
MASTQQLNITLPGDLADAVKQRVASGEYANESEVLQEGLQELLDRDAAVEQWLRTEVVASVQEMRADPSRWISSEDMRAHLLTLRAKYDSEHLT